MNKVSGVYWNKRTKIGSITVNGERCVLAWVVTGHRGFDEIREYSVALANDFNASNRIWFTGKTLRILKGRIERHQYPLIRFRV